MPPAEKPGFSTSAPRAGSHGALALAGALLALSHAVAASAAPKDEGAAAAGEQASRPYRDASRLVLSGHPDEACPMFKESDRLAPANGTRLELAKCYESTLRPASAWTLYIAVADAEGPGGNRKREAEARGRAAAIEPRLPRLVVSVSDEVKALPGLAVELDGAPVRGFGTAVSVDLGQHAVRASAPGKLPWERKVAVQQLGDTVEVTLEDMEDEASDIVSSLKDDPERNRLLPPPVRVGPDPEQQKLMWVMGGIAIVGVGAGSTFGGLAISKWDDVELAAKDGCRDPARYQGCSTAVRELQVRASSFATISTFSFIAGTTALAGTALLWFTLPATEARQSAGLQVTPVLGAGSAGASVHGAF
jgi:hypothetical protein